MPPASLRRPLTVGFWLLGSAAIMLFSPVLAAIAALLRAITGNRKPLIFLRLLAVYCTYELATLVACAALWLASGAGRLIRTRHFSLAHWRLLRWYLRGIAAQALSALEIRVVSNGGSEAERALHADGSLLLFSRHAGPGDTLVITDQLLSRFDRRPSVVLKEALSIDPCIDLLAHRLPHAVLDTSDRTECETEIGRVTRQLDRRGVLVLFPEGANFTSERRRSALLRLWRKGRSQEASLAERMAHVLPPHPTGVEVALGANPDADVIFVAHTGLGIAASAGELWRDMPTGRTLRMRMWLVPAAEVPRDRDAQTKWLYDWWKRIDQWIEGQD